MTNQALFHRYLKANQKNLQKYFNEIKGSLSKSTLLAGVLPIAFVSDAKDWVILELVLFNLGLETIPLPTKLSLSLKWFHKLPNVKEYSLLF